jgi:hypothetical protein
MYNTCARSSSIRNVRKRFQDVAVPSRKILLAVVNTLECT